VFNLSDPGSPRSKPNPDEEDVPEWERAGRVGFVRPPPEPPLSDAARRLNPLLTFSGTLIFLGLLLSFGGCGGVFLGAAAGWGPFAATGAAAGLGLLVLGGTLRVVTLRLQKLR
jgi:hypothetical protein